MNLRKPPQDMLRTSEDKSAIRYNRTLRLGPLMGATAIEAPEPEVPIAMTVPLGDVVDVACAVPG